MISEDTRSSIARPAAARRATAPREEELDAASDAGVEGADPLAVAADPPLERLLAGGLVDMAEAGMLVVAAAVAILEPTCLRETLCCCFAGGPAMAKQKVHRPREKMVRRRRQALPRVVVVFVHELR